MNSVNYLKIMSETYYKFLTSIDWNDQNLLNGLKEGKGKFLSNLWLSLFKAENNLLQKKYYCAQYISPSALEKLKSLDKQNKKKYTGLVFEHIIPKEEYIQSKCETEAKSNKLTTKFIYDLLFKYWKICTITKEEDKQLSRKMPSDWKADEDYDNFSARYDAVGLKYQPNPYFKTR